MDKEQLFDAVEKLEADAIKAWIDVCNIESPTDFKEGVDACGRYFIDKAERYGWDVEVHREEISGDAVCITMNKDAKGAPVAISGHIDTVHPVGLFGNPPVRVEGEKIYGPGVTDCKGGVVAGLLAMMALEECGFKDRPVMLIIQSDEEVGSKPSQLRTVEFMCEKAKDAVAFLNVEGHTRGKTVLRRKGIVRFELKVKGVSVHSCRCYEGSNAITEAAHKIIELEKMKDEGWGLTCNCGIISGGSAANTVPDECTFIADIRYGDQKQYKEAERIVNSVAATSYIEGTSCEVTQISHRIAMEDNDANDELLAKINEIYEECAILTLAKWESRGGSDAAYTTAVGIPTVDNFGTTGGRIHSPDEWAELCSMKESILRLATVAAFIKE